MDIIKTLAQELEIRPEQAQAAVELIDDGRIHEATFPLR